MSKTIPEDKYTETLEESCHKYVNSLAYLGDKNQVVGQKLSVEIHYKAGSNFARRWHDLKLQHLEQRQSELKTDLQDMTDRYEVLMEHLEKIQNLVKNVTGKHSHETKERVVFEVDQLSHLALKYGNKPFVRS